MIKTKKFFKQKKKGRLRVAFFSNGPHLPTGYAKVIREISSRLNKDPNYEVVIVNENEYTGRHGEWNGMPVYGLTVPIQMVGNNPEPAREKIVDGFLNAMKEIQPDIVVFLEDSFTLRNFGFEKISKTPYKRVFYIPLDGDWIPDIGINVIRSMDQMVGMSKFTQNSLAKEGFDSEMIWHGVDLEHFCPVAPEHQAMLKQKYGFKPDDFVIYNYGRNSNIRKNNQGMLWIMAKYLSEAPENHKFLFHTLQPDFPGNDLIDYISRHLTIEFDEGVVNRLKFSPFTVNNPASDQEVAEMIQMADLVITASTGEGFGLIMSEAMACAKPVISTDYTTPWELLTDTSQGIGERGWLVPVGATFVAGLNTEHAYVDKMKFVETLKEVISNKKEMQRRGFNGRLFAERYLNWNYLVEQWKKLFQKIA